MTNEAKLRKFIRRTIKEITTTGDVAGYATPYAFTGDKRSNKPRIEKLIKSTGYSLTPRGKEDVRPGDTLDENYRQYRNDTSKHPHQKIGKAIAEITQHLHVVERVLRMNNRLQQEYNLPHGKLWKRTQQQMAKMENKLMELATTLRNMRN
jgi:hypothetical protein